MTAIAEQIAGFVREAASVRRLSPHTVDSYRRDLQILADAAPDLAQVQADDIRKLLAQLGARGSAPASMSRRLSTWRTFFDWLQRQGLTSSNPARDVRAPKKKARLPRAMTPDETAHFLNSPTDSGNKWLATRDAAMFELLYSAGLRVGEMLALDVADVDFSDCIVRIARGKGGRGRAAPFGAPAKDALQKWLSLRDQAANTSALFINHRGERLRARTVQKRTLLRAGLAGCAGRVSPHVLRHSCASHFLQSSGDLRATQDLLGHADIASTQIYTRLDFQNLSRAYDRAHPRARKLQKAES